MLQVTSARGVRTCWSLEPGPCIAAAMRRVVLALAILLLGTIAAGAQTNSDPKVHARLIVERGEVAPGGNVTVALEEIIRPQWHTYWINPGEAGLPTEIHWQLPPGWRAGPIQWPYPKRLPVGSLMNYGYENKVWLLTDLTAAPEAKPGAVTLKAHASWLVCKEVCIPEEAEVSAPLTIAAAPSPPYPTVEEQFVAARAKVPSPSPWQVIFRAGSNLDVFISSFALGRAQLKEALFFPFHAGTIADFSQQRFAAVSNGLVLRLKPAEKGLGNRPFSGVIVLRSLDGSVQALSIRAKPGVVPAVNFPAPNAAGGAGLVIALAFALLGGVLLNVMPCVLPVLAMKALAIANVAHGERRQIMRDGLAYGSGAVLSFIAFGGAVVIFRNAGEAIGWGFQLQQPVVVAGFALLIFAIGLSLSGVFEVPSFGAGDALARAGGIAGSFFTGVLAVAVAAPCTAPFMATALGYAVTQRAAVALLVFAALGLGFALPFVLIGVAPPLAKWLPKPGAWMQRFRQFLAFPMYATALWLVWVLSFEVDPSKVLVVFALALIVAFVLWGFGAAQGQRARWRIISWVFLAIGVAAILQFLPLLNSGKSAAAASSVNTSSMPSRPFTAAVLEDLRAQHRPVFVNATAAWCITCLVNEKAAFSSAKVREAFARMHIAYLVADWTNRNSEITALLQAHGRTGVPLYLYYPPGASEARVLPQVLTEGEVLRVIAQK